MTLYFKERHIDFTSPCHSIYQTRAMTRDVKFQVWNMPARFKALKDYEIGFFYHNITLMDFLSHQTVHEYRVSYKLKAAMTICYSGYFFNKSFT